MDVMWLVALGSLISLGFAYMQFSKVKSQPEGTDRMIEIAKAIREGASAYLKRQYKGVSIFLR